MFKKAIYSLLVILVTSISTSAHALDIMLPDIYKDNIDVSGWLMSEKLDGVRGYWDGKKLMSKNGNSLYPPTEFIKNFPPFALEGELWGGRNTFENTVSIVSRDKSHDGWLELKFAIFDVPDAPGGIVQRLSTADEWFNKNSSQYAFVIPQIRVRGNDHLNSKLTRIENLGGEGLIVRKPDTLYAAGRSDGILKVKSYYDTEAVVIEHIEGSGRNADRMGSLLVELENGTRFKIGTGFRDKERENPPPVGSVITFKYFGFYKSGIPKFPSFMRIREPLNRQ